MTNAPSSVFLPAKLISDDGELPCIIKKVYNDRLQVSLFSDLMQTASLHIEMPSGARFCVSNWASSGRSLVLVLDESFDLVMLSKDWGGLPQRSIRMDVTVDGLLHVKETTEPIRVRNISQSGARIECGAWLAIDQRIGIELPDLPAISAIVRWRDFPNYGLTFESRISLGEIAQLN